MTPLSLATSPLPRLLGRAHLLRPSLKESLESALFPGIPSAVSDYYWEVVLKLDAILRELPFAAMQRTSDNDRRHRVLEVMKSVMHDITALTEYLGDMLAHALPTSGTKNKAAHQAKRRLANEVDFHFKLPINLVKHERFKLRWLERYSPTELTAGFTVSGVIRPNTKGPASYRFPVAEGYSFALILRRVLPVLFKLCDIAEEALAAAKLFEAAALPPSVPVEASRMALLTNVTELLAALPVRGFPNEYRLRAPQLRLVGQQLVVANTFRILDFKHGCKFSFEIGNVAAGEHYKMPYWVPDVGDPTCDLAPISCD